MMDMLRFRSRSQSSPSTPPAAGGPDLLSPGRAKTPSPRVNGSGAVCAGPARAIRLAYCDDKGKFRMEPEAVALLQLVKGPIGVVSVCGRARQGKSFVLNQLLGRTSGFQVASTHRPCTKGLWMWSAPLKRTAADGSEYNLVLLDTEGIDAYDQTGRYSTQIFSLAVLLSSMFIYNQMGGIDEAAIDRLSLVTEMTKHIRVRASGGRSSTSELGQFSPVFVWLLRDFYLDLTEDNRKITPRDYLELALRSVESGGKDTSSKNEIRESIRSLFPDRECFTLVRPVNDEIDLRRLDQIPLDQLRPEFRTGLDELTKFVFERTRPKQVGATVMTGPVFVGILQSFLEALNNGAVPTISSSWQSVEEAECHKAYKSAMELYMSSFDLTVPAEESILREAHEAALQKSLDAYNTNAVGSGSARMSYEKLLHNSLKKSFEEYKRTAFLEADLKCSNFVQSMEKKLREVCCNLNTNVDSLVEVLDSLLAEYELSSHGPSKWKILVTFLRQCLDGPISDFLRKKLDQIEYERSNLAIKCRAAEEKLGLVTRQLESSEKHKSEYLKRYEDAISDKQRLSDDLSARIMNLQSKCSTLEERCTTMSKDFENAKGESSGWRTRYEECCLHLKAEEEKFKSQKSVLESRYNVAEVRLAAAREQNESAQEEASEWRRKFDFAAAEAKTALEMAAIVQERNSKKAQEREDALREEFDIQMAKKEEEIKNLTEKFDQTDVLKRTLASDLEAAESKVANYDAEKLTLKNEINALVAKLESVKAVALEYEKQSKMLENEKSHLVEKYLTECKKFDEAESRCKAAEKEAKKAMELADAARAQLVTAQREKSEAQHLALERLTVIEKIQRQVDFLERKKESLITEMESLRESEMDAISKVASLEKRVEEREKEIEDLLSRSNEQRSLTVQVLEKLLATERAALTEANNRAEVLSMQLQVTQGKLDSLHQEMTSLRLNESALDSKLRTVSHGKRHRTSNYLGTESVQDMEIDDGVVKGKKRSRSTTSPLKYAPTEDGSIFQGDEILSENQETEETDSEDYTKFTVSKLKQELTKQGFGAELLKLKTPTKKDILALYKNHVLGN